MHCVYGMVARMKRCRWVDEGNALMTTYHDTEWGVAVTDDRKLFEFIVLESAQAGLSWQLILNKREGYRRAFKDFDPEKVARFTQKDVMRLMKDESIIRNQKKIEATIKNAHAFLEVQKEYGSFAEYMWRFVDHSPQHRNVRSRDDVPVKTELSEEMAKDLKRRGFSFLGPIVWYSHMQAVGMVNDHEKTCFRHKVLQKIKKVST